MSNKVERELRKLAAANPDGVRSVLRSKEKRLTAKIVPTKNMKAKNTKVKKQKLAQIDPVPEAAPAQIDPDLTDDEDESVIDLTQLTDEE